jgi:hypothetical protein
MESKKMPQQTITDELLLLSNTKKDIYNAIQTQLGDGSEKIIKLDLLVSNYEDMPFSNYDNVIRGVSHSPLRNWLNEILSLQGPTVIIPPAIKPPSEELEEEIISRWPIIEWPDYDLIIDTDWLVDRNDEISISHYIWNTLYKPLAYIIKPHSSKLDYDYDHYSYYDEYKKYSIDFICNEIHEILTKGIGRIYPVWDVTFMNWDEPEDIFNLIDKDENIFVDKTWIIGQDIGKAISSAFEILNEYDTDSEKAYLAESILGEFRFSTKITEKLDGEWTDENPRPNYIFHTADPNDLNDVNQYDLAEIIRAFIEDGVVDITDEEIVAFPPEYVVTYPTPTWDKTKDNSICWTSDYIRANFQVEENNFEDKLFISQNYAYMLKTRVLIYSGTKTTQDFLNALEEGDTEIETNIIIQPLIEDCIKEDYEDIVWDQVIQDDWDNFIFEELEVA